MHDYRTLSQRLARLEQKQATDRQMGTIASWLDDPFGRLLLESMPPEVRQAALLGGALCLDLQYPPLQAQVQADLATWRAQRGLPLPGSEMHL